MDKEELADIISTGKILGYEGEELQKFIREERLMRRTEVKERLAAEAAKERIAAETVRERLAAEEARERLAAEERRLEREFTLKMESNRLELARLQSAQVDASALSESVDREPFVLPPFDDSEDLLSYFARFEMLMSDHGWADEVAIRRLRNYMRGSILTTYMSLPSEHRHSYDLTKKALLSAYRKTSFDFKQSFIKAKPSPHESFSSFSLRLTRLFRDWYESTTLPRDFASLEDFVIAIFFFNTLSPESQAFALQHQCVKLADMAQKADIFEEARLVAGRSRPPVNECVSNETNRSPINNNRGRPDQVNHETRPLRRPNSSVKCYICGMPGHVARRCHKSSSGRGGSESRPRVNVSVCVSDGLSSHFSYSSGIVNGREITRVLRDTGCNSIIVSDKLIPSVDLSKSPMVDVYDFLGRKDSFPVVKCHLETIHCSGYFPVIVAPLHFCDLIVGNGPGVTDALVGASKKPDPPAVVGAVATRSSTRTKLRNARPFVPCFPADLLECSKDELAEAQKQCLSLVKSFRSAKNKEVIMDARGHRYRFVVINGLLCKEPLPPKGDVIFQIVLPEKFRIGVMKLAHESPMSGHFSPRRTRSRIFAYFTWPFWYRDVEAFCRSCDVCQRVSVAGRVRKLPLSPIATVSTPFFKIGADDFSSRKGRPFRWKGGMLRRSLANCSVGTSTERSLSSDTP